MDDQSLVVTDISTGYALSLAQRLTHPETTAEERERLQTELNALLKAWMESLNAAFEQFAGHLWAVVKPLVDTLVDWANRLWERAYPDAPKLRRFPPLPDKRAWQHSQKLLAQLRRQRRERARARTALFYRYRRI